MVTSAFVFLTAEVAYDPEVKIGQTGKEYVRFTVLTQTDKADSDGNPSKNFWSVVAFGPEASRLIDCLDAKLFGIGSLVTVSGRLQQEFYEKEGKWKSSLNVVASSVGVMTAPNIPTEEQPTPRATSNGRMATRR